MTGVGVLANVPAVSLILFLRHKYKYKTINHELSRAINHLRLHPPRPLQGDCSLQCCQLLSAAVDNLTAFPHFYTTLSIATRPFPWNQTLFFYVNESHFQCQSISWSSLLSTNPPNPPAPKPFLCS